MANEISGSKDKIFHTRDELEQHLLAVVTGNNNKLLGLELEALPMNPEGWASTRANVQDILENLSNSLFSDGYSVEKQFGRRPSSLVSAPITKLDVINLGSFTMEPGLQLEIVSLPSTDIVEISEKVEIMQRHLLEAVESIGHSLHYQGYSEKFAATTKGGVRERDAEWNRFYNSNFDDTSRDLLKKGQYGTASTQITSDSGGSNFHEYWSAALVLEPVLALLFNSDPTRLNIIKESYGSIMPQQVEPISSAWKSANPKECIGKIVDRLLTLPVPFLPESNDGHPSWIGGVQTIQDYLDRDALSEFTLNNSTGFFYTAPALRNVLLGTIEFRSMDSIKSKSRKLQALRIIKELLYDDDNRRQLLAMFGKLDERNIINLHRAPALLQRATALELPILNNGTVITAKKAIQMVVSLLPGDLRDELQGKRFTTAARSIVNCDVTGTAGAVAGAANRHQIPTTTMFGNEPNRRFGNPFSQSLLPLI
jgi:hypothetical protein